MTLYLVVIFSLALRDLQFEDDQLNAHSSVISSNADFLNQNNFQEIVFDVESDGGSGVSFHRRYSKKSQSPNSGAQGNNKLKSDHSSEQFQYP